MKVCFDTNVVIDLFARVERFPESYFAYDLACMRKHDCCVAAHAVPTIVYILERGVRTAEDAQRVISLLLGLFSVMDVTESDCAAACDSLMADYEDALLDAACARHGVDLIVTRNMKDFAQSSVPALSPERYVDTFAPPDFSYGSIEELLPAHG